LVAAHIRFVLSRPAAFEANIVNLEIKLLSGPIAAKSADACWPIQRDGASSVHR
jgi:hypothetical protein